MQRVGRLHGLEELNLTLTAVTDEGLRQLGGLTQLRVLGLASSQCTGSGFAPLGKLTHLESINFHFTPLNDEGLRAISEVGVQGRLWFAHTKFTDAGAASLAKLSGLRVCGIGSTHPLSSGDAVAALAGLPLEELSLLDRQATPAGLAHAAKIKSLRRLDLGYAPDVDDAALAAVAQLPHLEEFRIGAAQAVTDAGLLLFTETKPLKKLNLSGLKNVSETGIAAFRAARPDVLLESK
ncbi:MAG: hypothetical protein ACI9QL_004041 [Candidatus Omnitrophota bacterium]|jgi:hypothetical protein